MVAIEDEPLGPPPRPHHIGLIDPHSSSVYLDTERTRAEVAEQYQKLGLLVQAKLNQVAATDTPILDKGSNYTYK